MTDDQTDDQQLVTSEAPPQPQPRRLTTSEQIADLHEQIAQQNRHIDVLHRVVDQLIDAFNGEVGTDWRPDLTRAERARENTPEIHVAADHSRRGRRAEAKFAGEPSS